MTFTGSSISCGNNRLLYYQTYHIQTASKLFWSRNNGCSNCKCICKIRNWQLCQLRRKCPNYNFPILVIFGVEVAASALLMAVILLVVYTKGLKGFSGITIGGIVGLYIFFLSIISGASMNPARSLAPALISGSVGDLWLYWSATFVGTSVVAFLLRRKFISK